MSALSIQPTFPIFTDTDGLPLENGYIWIGITNLDPQSNPINVYWDAALTILAPQPIRTINGYPSRSGSPGRLYVNSDYSIRVQNSKGSLVYSAPVPTERIPSDLLSFTGFKGQIGTVQDLADNDGSDWIGFTPAGIDSVPRSAQDKMRESVSVTDFGAASAADPTTTTTAIARAISAVTALGGGDVLFPPGDFRINGILTLPGKVRLVGQGAGRVAQPVQSAATTLSWYGGATEMVRVGYQGAVVVNGGVEGIRLDGRVLATRGLAIKDFQHGVFQEIVITGTTVSALYMTNTPAYDPTGFCDFKGIQISLRGGATNSAHGILLDGIGGGVSGVTLCSWEDVRIEHANGDGVRVNERGDGMSWYNFYSFRAGIETGFAIRSTASASGVVSAWSFYNALPNGGIQIDTPNTAKGWVFDTIQDIDVDVSAQGLIFGNGRSDVSVVTSTSTLQKGPAKIRGFRNSIIEDPMFFRRWDSANNIVFTSGGCYLTGGTYAGSNIFSAGLPGGAVSITSGNAATNALYISGAGAAASGYSLTYEPQMAVTWAPVQLTNCVYRVGFVDTFVDLPNNGIYVEVAPGTSGFYRCVTRSGGVETATVTTIGISTAAVQWRIEYKTGSAQFLYRTTGNNQWALGASHTTNVTTVTLADVVYARTLEALSKSLTLYDYRVAWDLEL